MLSGYFIAGITILDELLDLFATEEGWQGRTGGVLTIMKDGRLSSVPLGTFPTEKLLERWMNSVEKARRIIATDKDTSHETRDPDHDKWGGAIRTLRGTKIIFSFSGLPELADEAFCIVLAIYTGELAVRDIPRLLKGRENPFIAPLYERVFEEALAP